MWGCNTPASEQQLGEASLRFAWIPSGSYAGEVSGANRFAEEHDLRLTCHAGGMGLNSITMVATGQNTFGTAAADEIIAAIDKGADLVIIGVINYYSPGCFLSLADKGISTPKDFEGRVVGLLPFGSTGLLYQALVRSNQVNESKVRTMVVSPDLKPFINGAYDVQPAFVYDETVTLDMQGINYTVIEPQDHGVSFRGQCYFCKKSTLSESPELVRSFVNTMIDGWGYALNNPDSTIADLKEFAPEIDAMREVRVLKKGQDYFKGMDDMLLWSEPSSWREMLDEMKRAGLIQQTLDPNSFLELRFVKEYYTGSGN
jgi:NitT/TauT family transport system substrate-binding protein